MDIIWIFIVCVTVYQVEGMLDPYTFSHRSQHNMYTKYTYHTRNKKIIRSNLAQNCQIIDIVHTNMPIMPPRVLY